MKNLFLSHKIPCSESELLIVFKKLFSGLGEMPLDKRVLIATKQAVKEIAQILTLRQHRYNEDVSTIREHINILTREIQTLGSPELHQTALDDLTFTKDQLRSQMLLDQDGILAPQKGILTEDLLREAEQSESLAIADVEAKLQVHTQQIFEARHPRRPLVSPKSYLAVATTIVVLILCLNVALFHILNLTRIELILLWITDSCFVIGSTLAISDDVNEEQINNEESHHDTENLRVAS